MQEITLSKNVGSEDGYRKYKTNSAIISVRHAANTVFLQWQDSEISEIDETWLQDNCYCSKCIHPTTRERLIHFTEKEPQGISAIKYNATGLHIVWGDGHESRYGNGWLRSYSFNLKSKKSTRLNNPLFTWDADSLQIPEYQYSETSDPKVMFSALKGMQRWGVTIFKNTPRKDKQVIQFAENIGAVRVTNFGNYFDIFTKPSPDSNAYTTMEFYPHTDIAHHEIPPSYQLLHFLDNNAEGGHSTLVDGFKIFEVLKENAPEIIHQLTKEIYTFRFQDDNTDHSYRGSIIELDQAGYPKKIRLDLIGMEPLIASVGDARNARKAIKEFFSYVVDKRFQYERKFSPGDLVLFENTRLLHGRTAYKAGSGKRRLQGCYLDYGEVMSYMQVLRRKLIETDGCVFDDAGRFIMDTHT